MLIIDMGAGDATKNSVFYVEKLISSVPQGDIVLKFQLFEDIPGLTPLKPEVFYHAWWFASKFGFKVTASVFDEESIHRLTLMQVPFVKIACNTDWYPLIDQIPAGIPVIVSIDSQVQLMAVASEHMDKPLQYLSCVPKYPATEEDYVGNFPAYMLKKGISDHTTDLELFKTYRPRVYERHYAIDDIGPDYEHAIGPEEVEECLQIMDLG